MMDKRKDIVHPVGESSKFKLENKDLRKNLAFAIRMIKNHKKSKFYQDVVGHYYCLGFIRAAREIGFWTTYLDESTICYLLEQSAKQTYKDTDPNRIQYLRGYFSLMHRFYQEQSILWNIFEMNQPGGPAKVTEFLGGYSQAGGNKIKGLNCKTYSISAMDRKQKILYCFEQE